MSTNTPPAITLNGAPEPTAMNTQPSAQTSGDAPMRPAVPRNDTTFSKFSVMSVPPEGSILTGKQEHCKQLKPTCTRVADADVL